MTSSSKLPVVVVGGGPVGLAAAAHLLARGEQPVVLEKGKTIGASVLEWGHVRLFSPWRYLVDPVAGRLLEASNWVPPSSDSFPTGRELVERYLFPLSGTPAFQSVVRLNSHVHSISRQGLDKMKTSGREDVPFALEVHTPQGEETFLARAVIDASGTYSHPNPLGSSGNFAHGEGSAASRIFYGIPEVLGKDRQRYSGKHVLVVGSGHSAFNALLALKELLNSGTRITWAIRRSEVGLLFGGQVNDALQARGELGSQVRNLLELKKVRLLRGFAVVSVTSSQRGLEVAERGERREVVDEIIATTGFRPELEMTRELRLALDPSLECPAALGPLIDPNVHSCGTVSPHGADQLAHPERNFYTVGMKSYGRAPTFLLLTGYEQVRSVVAALSGDWEAARDVRLVLPETGVCSTDSADSCDLVPAPSNSCCAPFPFLATRALKVPLDT